MVGPTILISGLEPGSYVLTLLKDGCTIRSAQSGSEVTRFQWDLQNSYDRPYPLHDVEALKYIDPFEFDYKGSSICTNSLYIKIYQSSPWKKGTKVNHKKPDTSIGSLLEGVSREVFHPPKNKHSLTEVVKPSVMRVFCWHDYLRHPTKTMIPQILLFLLYMTLAVAIVWGIMYALGVIAPGIPARLRQLIWVALVLIAMIILIQYTGVLNGFPRLHK